MPPRSTPLPAVACLALLAVLAACQAGAPEAAERVGGPVPRPNLEAMEDAARQRILTAIEAVEAAETGEDEGARAAAYGELGNLYLAYHLAAPAAECYRRAGALDPAAPRWPTLHGMALAADGSLAEAEASFERTLTLTPADPLLHLRLARLRLERGDAAAAAAGFRRVLELDATSAAAHEGLGRAAAEAGRVDEAIGHYRQALSLAPAATTLHYPLALLYRQAGDLEAARRHLALRGNREVPVDDPLAREIRRLGIGTAFDVVRQMAADADRLSEEDLLGYAIVQFGDVAAAVEEFERALVTEEEELAPAERARVRFVLGALYARGGDHRAAVDSYRTALDLDPGFAAARAQLGWSLTRLGDTDAGLREIEAVLAADPDDTRALLKRAAVRAETGHPREARRDLERLRELEPGNAEALLRLARLDEDAGQAAAARRRYRDALDLAMPVADRALVHLRLGELALGEEGPAAAAEGFRAALRLDPGLDRARLRLAAALVASGDPEGAAAELSRLVERRPGEPTAVLSLAAALIGLDRHAEARRVLEDGYRASGGEERIAALLARHLAAAPDRRVRDGQRALSIVVPLVERRRAPEDVETLAMALAEAGRFDDAAARQAELVALARRQGREADAARLERNLALYRRGERCCAAP